MPAATTQTFAPPGAPAARSRRAWPAILALFCLAPITAEVLSGSTPILAFAINPILAAINFPFYGCGALLAREVARRRGLGWAGVLWLGAAYGIFEEGVVINTWADPWAHDVCALVRGVATGLCDYSRIGGINVLWALDLTVFHAVVSITIPILLVSLLFPQRDARPWLGRKAIIACTVSEGVILVLGLILNFADFRQHGQPGPLPLPYLIELALMALCIVIALTCRAPAARALLVPVRPVRAARPLPRLWWLRFFGFLAIALNVLSPTLYQAAHVPYQAAFALNAMLLALATWRVWAWAHRADWTARHMLALASGALGFFIVFWAPLLELAGTAGGKPERGTGLVALVYLILLIWLTLRTDHRLRRQEALATA